MTERTLGEAVAVVLREIQASYPTAFKPTQDTPRTWASLLEGVPAAEVWKAWRRYAAGPHQFPPSPGQIRTLAIRAMGADSLSLSAGEAMRLISFREDGQRNVPTQVAIDCSAAVPGPYDTWSMPSEGPARAVAERKFTQAWEDIRTNADAMETLTLQLTTRNERIVAGELPPGHREENEQLARQGLARLGAADLGTKLLPGEAQ